MKRKKLRVILGFSLIGVGAIGMLLPLLPGIPLVLAGVALVGADHPRIQWLKSHLRRWRTRAALRRTD
ncbi:MAG TPA: hypothetical protein VLM91_07500 [Candidatus Methylomirabilis sp.]|nr:hypothetical protein [Candidatus Methylomirabilis sp.]